ncbi:MAG: lipoate--protein ligase [Clostridiales bacterium]|nr:lipoate--protein ligase [Clostridiales bacterium]
MLIIRSERKDARFFLAAEEYLLEKFDEEVFMLWRTVPTLMIGRNQNTMAEINSEYVRENDIVVVRRITGGGTIYSDLGNTLFTFISNEGNESFANFEKFARPIIDVLHKLGVNAEFSGRNDILIDGKKISGNAQYRHKSQLLHHGSLLFSSDMRDLGKALKPSKLKLESKSVESVRSRVTNISSHLKEPISIIKFNQLIYEHIEELYTNSRTYTFNEVDLKQINEIMITRYSSWDWNYGNSPKYTSANAKKFPGGLLEVTFDAINGKFAAVKIYGDFFSRADISLIEKALVGSAHDASSTLQVLETFDFDEYFSNISPNEFISLFF